MATNAPLVQTPRLTVLDIACRMHRSGRGAPRGGEATHLVFVRRGAFAIHVGARASIVDPCTAGLSWYGSEYRISHPGDAGDDCLVFELDPALADELLRGLVPHRDVELALSPRVQAAHAGAIALLRRWRGDPLACEEAALQLAQLAVGDRRRRARGGGRARRLALAAIARLHDAPATNVAISAISNDLGCSPGHLMHVFRAETGTTLRRYRLQLRVAAALHQLAAGRADLAGLAADLGFASHAHLTDTLSRLLGVPPAQLRAQLTRADRHGLRRFLEAPALVRR